MEHSSALADLVRRAFVVADASEIRRGLSKNRSTGGGDRAPRVHMIALVDGDSGRETRLARLLNYGARRLAPDHRGDPGTDETILEVIAMKLIRNVFAAGLVAAATVMACSSQQGTTGTGAGNTGTTGSGGRGQDGTGSVGMNLDLAPGVSVRTLHWVISNSVNSYSGDVTIGDAGSVEFVAGGIAAGTAYSIVITGADTRGDSCSGSTTTTFSVAAGSSTAVALAVVCASASDASLAADVGTGSVGVTVTVTLDSGTPVACPGITSFTVNPAEQNAGSPVQLGLGTTGPTPVVAWTVTPASGGTFSSTTSASPTFTCAAGGTTMTLTATVALPDSGVCAGQAFTTMSAVFTCEGAATDSGAVVDTGTVVDTGGPDVVDSGVEAEAEAGPVVLHPCTVVGDTACVQCQFNSTAPNPNKTCTPTEAAIVANDIARGHSTLAGPSGASSCYTCLAFNGCLDDTQFADTNHECEDSLVVGTAAQCEATLSCILGSDCSSASISICYCGTAGLLTTCQGNPAAGPINGACASTIAAGLGFPVTDGTDNTAQLTSTTFASGKADQIFQCALTNNCTACQN
jgi:hypothetical protein